MGSVGKKDAIPHEPRLFCRLGDEVFDGLDAIATDGEAGIAMAASFVGGADGHSLGKVAIFDGATFPPLACLEAAVAAFFQGADPIGVGSPLGSKRGIERGELGIVALFIGDRRVFGNR